MRRRGFLATLVALITLGRVHFQDDYQVINGILCYRGTPVRLKKSANPYEITEEAMQAWMDDERHLQVHLEEMRRHRELIVAPRWYLRA